LFDFARKAELGDWYRDWWSKRSSTWCCRYLHRLELLRQAHEKDSNPGYSTNKKATSSNRANPTRSLHW